MAATSGQLHSSIESSKQSIECTNHRLNGSPEPQVSQPNSPEAEQVNQWSCSVQQQMAKCEPAQVADALLPTLSLTAQEDCELKQQLSSSRDSSSPDDQKAEEKSSEESVELKPTISAESTPIELRFLVRRREAGALIGKRGLNIKRLRETFRCSMFSIPDTGNGPERVVCIVTNEQSVDAILSEFTELLWEKSPENDEQIELKILIHSSHAGSIIGIGGQSIKKLRNDSKAAIKIYEMCCPLSNERVCAIKAKPAVVVSTIKLIHSILRSNPTKGTVKAYDALHFDLNLVDKYGGYLHDEQQVALAAAEHLLQLHHHHHQHQQQQQQHNNSAALVDHYNHFRPEYKRYSLWRSANFRAHLDTCQFHEPQTNTCQQLASQSSSEQQQQRDVGSAVDETSEKSSVVGGVSCAYSTQPTWRLNRFHPYATQMRNQQADHFGQHYLRPLHHHHHHHHQLPPAYLRFQPNGYNGPSTPLLNRNHYQQQQQQQHHLFPFGLASSDRCRHARPTCNHHLPSSSGPSVHQHQVVAHNNATAAAPFMQLVKQFNHQPNSNSNNNNNNNNNNKKK